LNTTAHARKSENFLHIQGARKENHGKFLNTAKTTATTRNPHKKFGDRLNVTGCLFDLLKMNRALQPASTRSVAMNSALSFNASRKLPCSSAYNARVAPQPGQYNPVAAWNMHVGKKLCVLGLKKNTIAPAPSIAADKTMPAKIAGDGGAADFIFGGTARMAY
jgi:hypothetical protein